MYLLWRGIWRNWTDWYYLWHGQVQKNENTPFSARTRVEISFTVIMSN